MEYIDAVIGVLQLVAILAIEWRRRRDGGA